MSQDPQPASERQAAMRSGWRRRISVAGLCVALVVGGLVAATALSPPVALAAATEFGVYSGPGCDGRAKVGGFEHWTGRHVARVVDFLDQRDWPHLLSSATWIAQCWRGSGYALTLSLPMLTKSGDGTLADGAAGKYDDVFRTVAHGLIDNGYANATIRIGWEANGDWMPWKGGADPKSYILYWRRIVADMRSVQGQHFKFEWCQNLGKSAMPADQLYPGDDVVDLVGLDVYNQYWDPALANADLRWMYYVQEPFGLQWQHDFAQTHHKATSFPEWGTGLRPDGHGAGDDPRFIRGMADWFARTGPAYQSYWDVRADDYDSEISKGHYPQAGAAFLKTLGKP